MKNLIKLCLVATMIFLPFSCDQDSIDTNAGVESFNKSDNNKSFAPPVPVLDYTFAVIPGTSSTLHRSNNGLTVNFKTKGLIPGNAYTLWWVIWNNPEYCLTSGACSDQDLNPANFDSLGKFFDHLAMIGVDALYGAGHIAGASGTGNFSSHLNEGDASGSGNFFGPGIGLNDSHKAEVHMILHSHGPAQPGVIAEQIHTVDGGCDPAQSPLGFWPDSDIEGYCRDIQAAIHAPN